MRIAVISDTHIPKKAKKLPDRLTEELKQVDLIIHAGDWQTIDVYHALKAFAPVEGVVGNVDGDDMKDLFGKKKILTIQDKTIGIVHGDGKGTTEKRAIEAFSSNKVDIIIYGHSHIPVLKEHNGILLFNPGSPTDKRRQAEYSFGIMEIENNINIHHIYFTDKT